MVDWTIFSPSFLLAIAEWAAAVVTVLALGRSQANSNPTQA